jgi:hypothetical protein
MNARKKEETTTRLSYAECEAKYADSRRVAMEKALQGERVRYKSDCDPTKFKKFLEHRLTIWDELKDKTFHGKKMHEKTKSMIDQWN